MFSNQRVSGAHFPSHSTSSYPLNQAVNERLNHWCDELEQYDHIREPSRPDAEPQKSKIMQSSPPIRF
ncbi:hypothetical protein MUN89_15065 [Halobacillus salinarum]|uniref:Uncharacterized protein n=1 Tax=Halobacillus salinarum TaxID=2932257 RepID=A0ABY4EHZ2_9BACI|nr:hypothetical protein [Halobacillus salinarum]UOQ43244.1 hypothetical protein MUN89_15065 [Halobacillus salinarum]